MADLTVLQTIYAAEFQTVFEQKQSFLRGTVTTDGTVNGNNYIFIIESLADTAKTRGASGNIPYAADNQSSATCSLTEYHHLARKNNFDIASSSVPQRTNMQKRGVTSLNQRTDQLILAEAAQTTYNCGGAAAGVTLGLLLYACSILDTNYVPDDGERYGLLTPMAWAWTMKISQFTSWDWVGENDKPFMRQTQWREWNGVKWARHPNLPGTGTSSASCFVYHKGALGHALNQGEMQSMVGVNTEHDYSWARVSAYMGAKLIQGGGVVKVLHNDTTSVL
jgi:hypothetical protein